MSTTDLTTNANEDDAVACQDCEWEGKVADVLPIKDIEQRISPGEEVPAGECPKCGCLASLVKSKCATALSVDGSFPLTLIDQSDSSRTFAVSIRCENGVIELRAPGYGTSGTEPGHSGPLYIELYEGHLRALAWADINQEDPTHTIDLEGARETNRKEG